MYLVGLLSVVKLCNSVSLMRIFSLLLLSHSKKYNFGNNSFFILVEGSSSKSKFGKINRIIAQTLSVTDFIYYWQTELPQWEGGRLFDGSAGFFYGNSCNSGTESRKMVSKVGN